MKLTNIYLTLLITGLTLLASSCVDDDIINKNGSVEQGDTQYYVKLRLKTSNDTFTRADESIGNFQDGTHKEHAIGNAGNFAIFFDGDDKYIACADLYSVNETGAATKPEYDEETDELIDAGSNNTYTPESYYSARFYGFADRQPAKVLVVVNAEDDIKDKVTDFPGWTLDEVMKQVWERNGKYGTDIDGTNPTYNVRSKSADPLDHIGQRWVSKNERYFTMTNSTYINEEEVVDKETGEKAMKKVVHCAEPINLYNPDNEKGNMIILKEGVEPDKDILAKLDPVTINLERMVAKFSLNILNPDGKYTPYHADALDVCRYEETVDAQGNKVSHFNYSQYTWQVQLLSWGVNALERSNYLFKNVNPTAEYFGGAEQNDPWGWNSTLYKRCYWSEDPHYEKEEAHYPWQYRDAADKNNDQNDQAGLSMFRNYKNPQNNEPFSLTYYPFTKFCRYVDFEGNLYPNELINQRHPTQAEINTQIFNKDGNLVGNDFIYRHNDSIFYTPENTYRPGILVDRTRATRAYELAGTHILLAAQLRIDLDKNNQYNHVPDNIYRNRVGVSYIDEVDMFEDFMNAVNYKLASQKYLYYNYSPWEVLDRNDEIVNKRGAIAGDVYRARVGGSYALYYLNEQDNEFRELTYKELQNINEAVHELSDGTKVQAYSLTVEANALNGDGKVMPWICYRKEKADASGEYEDDYTPMKLYILKKDFVNSDDFKDLNKDSQDGYNDTQQKLIDMDEKYSKIDDVTKGEVIKRLEEGDDDYNDFVKYIRFRRVNFQYKGPEDLYEAAKTEIEKEEEAEGEAEETKDGWHNLPENLRDDNDLKSVINEIWGVADHFNHGLMYYAVPIEALKKDKTIPVTKEPDPAMYFSAEVPKPAEGSDNYYNFYGYHGVVRNNWYKFNLRTINGIGIPISVPSQPIVPNYHRKLDQTKVEMEILQWHVEDITVPL